MNRRAQSVIPVLSVMFGLLVFVILWALFFGSWLSEVANEMIVTNGLTGIEAFLMSYINVWVFVGVVFGTLVFLYYGGG